MDFFPLMDKLKHFKNAIGGARKQQSDIVRWEAIKRETYRLE